MVTRSKTRGQKPTLLVLRSTAASLQESETVISVPDTGYLRIQMSAYPVVLSV
jgi:hypothetical protein